MKNRKQNQQAQQRLPLLALCLVLVGCVSAPPPPCWAEGSSFVACSVALDANHYAGKRWEELGCEGEILELYPDAPWSTELWDPERTYAEWVRLITAESCGELLLEPELF